MKLLYSQSIQQIYDYPRSDNQPVVGLDPDFLVLTRIDTTPPEITGNQSLSSTYVVDIPNLEYRQQWTVIDNPPVPDWPGFNLAITSDADMIAYEAAANALHPSIVGKKDLAYSIIADKGLDNFASIFPVFCSIANVSQPHREAWATLAESYNLPADFATVIRG